MNRKIRLIWDFYGERAVGTAEHHVIHLIEFLEKEKFVCFNKGTKSENESHAMAFITVEEKVVFTLRDTLKPDRAFVEK